MTDKSQTTTCTKCGKQKRSDTIHVCTPMNKTQVEDKDYISAGGISFNKFFGGEQP